MSSNLGAVYMRKLAPARVSHWDDFLISYRVYMMTGSFHILLFKGTFHVDKIHVWFKIANIMHALPFFQSTGRPISHLNGWSFRFYMIPLRDFVPEWNSGPGARTGVNSRRGDSCRDNIFWWYHVNKYRAKRGNRSELALGRKWPRCHVNTPLYNQGEEIFKTTPEWTQFSQGGQRKRKKKTMKRWPKNSHDNLD